MVEKNSVGVFVEYKNWYKCFREELFRQPGVEDGMTIVEASKVVAETNPYINGQLSFIRESEIIGFGTIEELADIHDQKTGKPKLLPFMHLDFLTQDYIALYLALKNPQFASIASVHIGNWSPDPRYEKPALIQAFLALHDNVKKRHCYRQ